uniref:Cytochrome P450 n=1 Tax=Spermophilus dauricus TaxID=99837 RepID=A0A8C9P1Z1_SPEDA
MGMMILVALLAGLSSTMVLKSAWQQRSLWRKMPPELTQLPFIGNYLQLDTNQMYDSLMKMRKHYCPVFTIHLGTRQVVVLYGYNAVKEVLVDQAEEFSGRGQQATFDHLFKGYGVAFSNWEPSKPLRRCCIAMLQDFGVNRHRIEERIQEEAGFLIKALRDTHVTFTDPTFYLNKTAANIIIFSKGQLFDMFYSVMKHLPGPQQQVFKELQGLEDFVAKKVEQNQRTMDPNSPWDFIDSFLIRMQEEKNKPHTEFHMENLVMTTLSLFFWGVESTSRVLYFSFLVLTKHPEVRVTKIHKEIDQVIGKNRQPSFGDRTKMPYTEGVIHEIQRSGNVTPMGVAPRVTKDTIFRHFLIPRLLLLFPMLGSLLNDPKFFSTPDDFNPQHFLDDKGQLKKTDADVPFSMGRPYCLGEGLARMELFLFLTTILQNFCFKSPQSPQDIDISPKSLSLMRTLPDCTMSFLPR